MILFTPFPHWSRACRFQIVLRLEICESKVKRWHTEKIKQDSKVAQKIKCVNQAVQHAIFHVHHHFADISHDGLSDIRKTCLLSSLSLVQVENKLSKVKKLNQDVLTATIWFKVDRSQFQISRNKLGHVQSLRHDHALCRKAVTLLR